MTRAATIRFQAERKAGEFLGEMELDAGRRTDLVPTGNQVKPTLSDLGIDKKESHCFQLLAGVPGAG